MTDELLKPLRGRGEGKPPKRTTLIVTAAIAAVAILGGGAWFVLSSADPEPDQIAVPIEDAGSSGPVVIRAAEAGDGAGVTIMTPEGVTIGGGGATIRGLGGGAPVQLAAAANPQLLETGPYGLIPRIGAGGLRPFDAYARPSSPPAVPLPRIAIIVGGIGINRTGTEQALSVLPGEITLALAPYGSNLPGWAAQARQAGHEILLQIPLEPFDFPTTDPGEHTLLVDDPVTVNLDRLAWLMSQFESYAGVVTYAGGRFTADESALRPFVQELGGRGLMLVDDGASARSRTADVAVGITPFARADLVLDAVVDATAIANRLAQIETIARDRGFAIASASAFPVTIEAIRAWSATARSRGFQLVPVTALAVDPARGTVVRVP